MRLLLLLLGLAGMGLSQPYINYRGVVNVASYMAPGLASGALPRGGMIAIFGRNLGPANGVQASTFPLSATLSGVTVTVTQQSLSVSALPVYVGPGQVNAILPSNAPLGRAVVRVTVNGVASNPSPIDVASSSFGVFTVNSAGFGPAILQNYNPAGIVPINSPQLSAKPGQVAILWGTGLGPVARDEIAPAVENLPVKVEVFVGGKLANPIYAGRSSCCAGIDQVNFAVPADAPTGCYVPVVVRVAGIAVSNTATMAIQADGQPCSDPASSLGALLRSGGRLGAALLNREDVQVGVGGTTRSFSIESGIVALRQEAGGDWAFNPYLSFPPLGACTAYTMAGDFPALNSPPGVDATVKDLDGGSSVSVSGQGTATLARRTAAPALYGGILATSPVVPGLPSTFLTPGVASTLSGTGGADVGSFQANVTPVASLVWTNIADAATVNRAAGFTVTWSGAPAGSNVVFIVGHNVDRANNVSAGFLCLASPAAGRFDIPAIALANLPPTPAASPALKGWLSVGAAQLASPGTFQAAGLDKGIALFGANSQRTVAYK